MLEVEVKIQTDNLSDIRDKLENLDFSVCSFVYEKDCYFDRDDHSMKNQDKAIRIRESRDLNNNNTKYTINFKGPKIDSSTMSRKEIEFEIPSFEEGYDLIVGLGFHLAGKVEKKRIMYLSGRITCCLDYVVDLGDFLEVEILARDEQDYLGAMDEINGLIAKLGLDLNMSVRKSYLCLLESK